MFAAALFTIAKIQKQPTCSSTKEWATKMWWGCVCVCVCVCMCVYTFSEYYLVIKKNEILPFATTWMGLKSMMLSEISQTEKDKYSKLSHTCGI